jgi:hypothetical protein
MKIENDKIIKEAQLLMQSAKINYLKKSYEERVKHWKGYWDINEIKRRLKE